MSTINDALPAEVLLATLTQPEIDPMRPVLGRVCSKWRSIVSMAPAPQRDAWSLLDAYAADRDFVGLFEWMDDIGRPRALAACQAAAAGGRSTTLMWLVEHGWPVDMSVYAAAARMGHAHALAWLLLRPDALIMDESVLDGAISKGCTIDHLEWLVSAGAPWPAKGGSAGAGAGAMHAAGRSGKIEVVEWVARAGPQPPAWADAICGAAWSNRVDVLTALYKAGHFQDAQGDRESLANAFFWASSSQSLDAMAWLADRDASLTLEQAICAPAQAGKLASVRWIVERNREADPTWKPCVGALMDAVRGGHLAVVRYLCEPLAGADDTCLRKATTGVYFEAACAGQWHVVEWAVSAAVPWRALDVLSWVYRLSIGASATERSACLRLIDDGLWRCSPALRQFLVDVWQREDAAKTDDDGDSAGSPARGGTHAVEFVCDMLGGFLGCGDVSLSAQTMGALQAAFGLFTMIAPNDA